MIDDNTFLEIKIDPRYENICSPDPLDLHPIDGGILINIPEKIYIEDKTKLKNKLLFGFIPVCGYYSLPYLKLPKIHSISGTITNENTKKYWQSKIDYPVDDPSPLIYDPLREEIERHAINSIDEHFFVGAYFNANLQDFFDLPKLAARYSVYVQIGEFKSNTQFFDIIDLREKPPQNP